MVKKKDPEKFACTFGCGRYGTAEEFYEIKVFGKKRYVCPKCKDSHWKPTPDLQIFKDDELWGKIPKSMRQELPWSS